MILKPFGGLSTAIVLAATFITPAAFAHAELVGATPAANATVSAPGAIALKFSEALASKLSGFAVSKAGKKVALNAVAVDAKDRKAMTAAPKDLLTPGVYTVTWHAVADDDGHKTQGTFKFTVK